MKAKLFILSLSFLALTSLHAEYEEEANLYYPDSDMIPNSNSDNYNPGGVYLFRKTIPTCHRHLPHHRCLRENPTSCEESCNPYSTDHQQMDSPRE